MLQHQHDNQKGMLYVTAFLDLYIASVRNQGRNYDSHVFSFLDDNQERGQITHLEFSAKKENEIMSQELLTTEFLFNCK